MDVGRRLETSGPETKDCTSRSTAKQLESVPFARGSHTGDAAAGIHAMHTVVASQPRNTELRESTAFTASSKQACSSSGERCYISQGYQLYKQR